MAIITLARQVGSGGQTIAAGLAQQLGYRLVERRELREEARARGLDLSQAFVAFADENRLDGPLLGSSHLYLSYGELEFAHALRGVDAVPIAAEPTSFLDQMARERRTLFLLVQGLIYDVASHDRAVIVGAGGQLILAGVPGVLRVKIIAPEELRASRLMTRFGLSPDAAWAAIRRGDREQREYNRAVFDTDWDDPLHWDLVLNTEFLDTNAACDLILSSLALPTFAEGLTAASLSALAVAGRIDLALHADPLLDSAWIFAVPAPDGLVLDGEASSQHQVTRATELARGLAGAINVSSRIQVDALATSVISEGFDSSLDAREYQ